MKPTEDKEPVRAIGYARVSTELQNKDGHDLSVQEHKIRSAADKQKYQLVDILPEVGSAAGSNIGNRPQLVELFRRAKQEGLLVIVTDATRLFRNVASAKALLERYQPKIFSVRDGRILGMRALLNHIANGERIAESTRAGTKKARKRQKAAGERIGTIGDHPNAVISSAKVRTEKAEAKISQVVQILLEKPQHENLTHRQLADLLNQRGILTTRNANWTPDTVVRVHRDARAQIKDLRQFEEEVTAQTDTPFLHSANVGTLRPGSQEPAMAGAPCTAQSVSEEDEEELMRQNPIYGMF